MYNPEIDWSQHSFLIIPIRVELYFASRSEVEDLLIITTDESVKL